MWWAEQFEAGSNRSVNMVELYVDIAELRTYSKVVEFDTTLKPDAFIFFVRFALSAIIVASFIGRMPEYAKNVAYVVG